MIFTSSFLLFTLHAGAALAELAGNGNGGSGINPAAGNVPQGVPFPQGNPANIGPGQGVFGAGTPAASVPALTGLAAPGPTPNGQWITAHPDGNCLLGLKPGAVNTVAIGAQFPAANTTHSPAFPGAESVQGGAGYDVWWAVSNPAPGCRIILMKPYAQTAGTPGLPAGKEILNVGRAGCFFGNVPPMTDLLTSICCGSACTAASLNSTSLLAAPTKRDLDLSEHAEEQAEDAKRDLAAEAKAPHHFSELKETIRVLPDGTDDAQVKEKRDADTHIIHFGSLAANAGHLKRYYYPTNKNNSGGACSFAAGQPYSQAGQQVIVTSAQSCPTGPCLVAVSNQISFSTTATSSRSQTITNGGGFSIGVEEGVDFLATATVTDTFSVSFSDAVQKTTGMEVMTGNSTTITNTLTLKLGNTGAVSFTPVYKCYTGPLDCGAGKSDPINVCQPDMTGINGTLKGEYDVVVYDG